MHTDSVELELHNARLLFNLKLPVPKCYELIFINNRNGLLYEKNKGNRYSQLSFEKYHNIEVSH